MAIKFKTKEQRDRYLASQHKELPLVPSPSARRNVTTPRQSGPSLPKR